MLLGIHPENPNQHEIEKVIQSLKQGGVIIYPTDTIYAIGCDIYNQKAIERICLIKGIKLKNAHFSFICNDLSQLSDFTRNVTTPVYKIMRKALPGAFTFILKANNKVPKLFKSKKKTAGIRIPDNNIARKIVKELGNPLLSTSVHKLDGMDSYPTDPELIHQKYKDLVDITIDGGYGGNEASTVIDCTGLEPEIIREGKGILK
ncbi:MAG TPA: threonylcarbamoyl-AMP synthase [Flavobacteriales bacterium]|nr:threonylcarbamoyl-AMP synthase [Flavobacteriales bacterium]HIN40511.1 threonylcarbamoyl-AMP synthase [Flavobacteriales bacterium]